MKKWLALVTLVGLVSAVGYLMALSYRSAAKDDEPSSPPITRPTSASVPALWASSASTVPELVAEADLVARVRAISEPDPRTVSFSGPILAEDGTSIGEGVDKVTFSDTQMEVLEIYKGSTEKFIAVMQTGSVLQGNSLEGDPLYVRGEESILFLVDISDDPTHAKGRSLYRIVNPAGRYTIQGSQVLNLAELPPSITVSKDG